MRSQPLYTDMGPDITMRDGDGVVTHLPRYGVWKWDSSRQRHQVADTGDDLEALRAQHGEGPLVPLPTAMP